MDILDRLKKMHKVGVDLEFNVSLEEKGSFFYEGKVHHMVGYYASDDTVPICYYNKSVEVCGHEDPGTVLDEMEAYIGTLDIVVNKFQKKEGVKDANG